MYRKFFKIHTCNVGGSSRGEGVFIYTFSTVDNCNSESNIRSLMNSWNFQINNSGIKQIVIFCFAFFREISILQNISDFLIALYQCDAICLKLSRRYLASSCTVHLCSENLAKNDSASL